MEDRVLIRTVDWPANWLAQWPGEGKIDNHDDDQVQPRRRTS